ncbi:MAG: hypothetical protein EXQ60_05805 [Candidatus Nanopelagicales bacterium]|nr:hypothetical protein [Candidatus Nanopelagicales bacterium]
MIIDCGTCQVAGLACSDCVVTVLLGPPAATVQIADDHQLAVGVLTDSGLIPPLRLVTADNQLGVRYVGLGA